MIGSLASPSRSIGRRPLLGLVLLAGCGNLAMTPREGGGEASFTYDWWAKTVTVNANGREYTGRYTADTTAPITNPAPAPSFDKSLPGGNAAVDDAVAQWAFDRGEPAGFGTDTLTGIEILVGGTGNDVFTAANAGSTLRGGAGNDTLTGGSGDDVLQGGAGNDTFIVDGSDTVVELVGGGTDEVRTISNVVSIASFANVENLTITGKAAVRGTGNDLDNLLTGNTAYVLQGGAVRFVLCGAVDPDSAIADHHRVLPDLHHAEWGSIRYHDNFSLGHQSARCRVG